MQSEVAVWENKFRNLAAVSELKAKVTSLKHEMAWAEVAQKEKVCLFVCFLYFCSKMINPVFFTLELWWCS